MKRPDPELRPGHEKVDLPLLDAFVRWRFAVFGLLSAALLAGGWRQLTADNDWYFFSWGSDLLFGHARVLVRSDLIVHPVLPGGLHLYASYPFLQIGPPALLIARLLEIGPHHGILLAGIVVQALGLTFVLLLDSTFKPRTSAARWGAFAGGVVVSVGWSLIAHYRHLDDALTLVAMAGAYRAIAARRPVVCGILLGIAAASKPWGVALVPLAGAFRTSSERTRAGLASLATAALFWGPFLVVDRGTLSVGKHYPYLAPDGPLFALGLRSMGEGAPLRLVQFAVGALVVAGLVSRGLPGLAPLAAFSIRLGIDPAANFYYPAAVLAAAYLADASTAQQQPRWTLAAVTAWVAAQVTHGTVAGTIRLATYAGLLLAVLLVAAGRERNDTATTALGASPRSGPSGR